MPLFKQKWDQVKLLMTYWRLPSIWIGETEECACPKKNSNIMKKHIIVKIVPRQIIGQIINLIINYVQYLTKKHDIKSKITCELISSTRYWNESVSHDIYQAARRATIQVKKIIKTIFLYFFVYICLLFSNFQRDIISQPGPQLSNFIFIFLFNN